MAYERITKGTRLAPYGRKADGTPKQKPGRKTDKQRARAGLKSSKVKA